ncbi:high mobility group protein [Cryptosporidium ubiquitum]|uniref:High mobility group protein n=1 Tax=Cryptosporidium ubiquitum TaxID=857276 RepID=A0A1J4MC50_9CRYT|nr:high mobility group protein [Cryptosporidium ubiquitum]OII71782.1 high mobility group protein [Cryptosporidium ubiquitum]
MTQNMKTKKTAKVSKKEAKKNKPKRAMTAFMYFASSRRAEITAENPSLRSQVAEVAKILGEEWRGMSESDKAPFQKQADADKKRYEREKAQMAGQ